MVLEAKTMISLGKEEWGAIGKGMRGLQSTGKVFYLEDDYMGEFMLSYFINLYT